MASVLKLSLVGPEIGSDKMPSGWGADLYEATQPERGWLFYALKGVDADDIDRLVEEFTEGEEDFSEFVKSWLMDLHRKHESTRDKPRGVILWFSGGNVYTYPLGKAHVFQHGMRRKRCLTDPIYDFTHYLRWDVLSPGEADFRVSYAVYPIHPEDMFEIVLSDGTTYWKISVDDFQDVWQSGEKKKKIRVRASDARRKYGHRASVWVAVILIFLVGAWYIWYSSSLKKTISVPIDTATGGGITSSTGQSSQGNFIEPLALWSTVSITDIATETYKDVKLPISTVWDMSSVKWSDGTYFVAFTNDVGTALRIAFQLKSDHVSYLDKWYKATTISKPTIEGVDWTSPKTFVSPDLSGGNMVIKSTFVNSSWGTFDGLSDAFLDKLIDISIQADGYDTTIALLTDDKVYIYGGKVGGIFKQLRMPISLPDGYHGERVYISSAGDVYVLAYRSIRQRKKYTLIVMKAADDFIPDELVMEKTSKLLDNLSATFLGAPYLWKEGVVAIPVAGPKDGLALINLVTWKATLIEGKGVIYPLEENKLGVVFQSFFSLWDLERRD